MSEKTKDKIIDTAIQLFNSYGTSSISTNHIAKELGISTGNLYYHYENKEEIIREVLERMILDWNTAWSPPKSDWIPNLQDLQLIIRFSFQLEWKYRFFYRELLVLMKIDPELKERHQEIQQQRIEEQKKFFQQFIDAGVLRKPNSSAEIDSLLKISWIISNYWISFLESGGDEVTEEQLENGIQLIMTVITPYINN